MNNLNPITKHLTTRSAIALLAGAVLLQPFVTKSLDPLLTHLSPRWTVGQRMTRLLQSVNRHIRYTGSYSSVRLLARNDTPGA